MIRFLPGEILRERSRFLQLIRSFLTQGGYLEVETPLLNPTGNFEPFIDPVIADLSGHRKSPAPEAFPPRSYLITSPEYNLKSILSTFPEPIFQIAHAFRRGDRGPEHSEEFLMLEFYRPGMDDRGLMKEIESLIRFLHMGMESEKKQLSIPLPENPFRCISILELFTTLIGIPPERAELENYIRLEKLHGPGEKPEDFRFDELFFTVFLNRIEMAPLLEGPLFLCDYPEELRANAKVQDGFARRFELYWRRTELCNGYYEETDASVQRHLFEKENQLRKTLGKEIMQIDPSFDEALSRGLPDCSGVAIGLDRLFMLLVGKPDFESTSPFP